MTARLRRCCARLRRNEDGAVLVETIITLPVILVFLVGLLEFSSLLLAKLHVETGLKDAARYMARCNPSGDCNPTWARNIAVFGHPNPPGGTPPRVHGWSSGAIDILGPSSRPLPDVAGQNRDVIRVFTNFNFPGSPLIGLLGLGGGIPIRASHEERVVISDPPPAP